MAAGYIKSLSLKDFRNFNDKTLFLDSYQVLITGLNGAGKTSILEAISMLSAGKGLRGAKFQDQIRKGENGWALKFEIESYLGNVIIEQSNNATQNKRTLCLNSRQITAAELCNFTTVFWLTPQLNTLFQESQTDRRKFFDRIVYAFYPEHASNIHKYEHYQKERLKILLMEYYDPTWVEIIEDKLSLLALNIAKTRLNVKSNLQQAVDTLNTPFPKIQIELESKLEEIISSSEDVNLIKVEYAQTRKEDARMHRSHFGALKTDFSVIHLEKNMQAKLCSTGEQQACLITLLLAQTECFLNEKSRKPILLLDELFVHLDHKNKTYLTNYIKSQKIQTFVTTTEAELCAEFASHALCVSL